MTSKRVWPLQFGDIGYLAENEVDCEDNLDLGVKMESVVKDEEANVRQKHSRILREKLAWIAKRTTGYIQKQALLALSQFAVSVGEYCEHPEQTFIASENANACLDCGKRLPQSN